MLRFFDGASEGITSVGKTMKGGWGEIMLGN